MSDRGFIGGLFTDDCAILFFIIVFLLLFVKPYPTTVAGAVYPPKLC